MASHVDIVKVEVKDFSYGIFLSVDTFELSVAVGAVPVITLGVLPASSLKTVEGQRIPVSAPDIDEMTGLYRQLLGMARQLEHTATIELSVYENEKPDEVAIPAQSVTLKGWILTDAGLSSLTPTASPVLTVVFSHPAIMLDKSGMIYEELSNMSNLLTAYEASLEDSVIGTMDNLYDAFAEGYDITFRDIADKTFGGTEGAFKGRARRFRRSLLKKHRPGRYIKDATRGRFMSNICEGELAWHMGMETCELVRPRAFCGSTWNRLVTEICPNYLTTIVPTYTKKRLTLEPNSPWQRSSYQVDTSFVSTFDMSPNDPHPIIGVAIDKAEWDAPHVVRRSVRTPQDNQPTGEPQSLSYTFYFPDTLEKDAPGEIMPLGEARLVKKINNLAHTLNYSNKKSLEEAGSTAKDKDMADMDVAYAKAMFLLNYRRSCQSTVVTTPMFKDANNMLIIPGRVVTIYDEGGQAEIIHGYLVRFMVRGSTSGGCCSIMELTHVRPASDSRTEADAIYVEEGTENPCYPPLDHNLDSERMKAADEEEDEEEAKEEEYDDEEDEEDDEEEES